MRIAPKARNKGSALIEIAVSYGALVIIGLLMMRASINVAAGQAWTVKQAMSDAYLTREVALAQRVPFDDMTDPSSLWAQTPNVTTSSVTIGRLPGGSEVTATLYRTRIPDENNLSSAGGSGNSSSNPGGTEAWKLQSILSYEIDGKDYVKSRTTLRIR